MLDRVARLPGAPCLLVRANRLGGLAFCHVNGSYRAIPASRGEINLENMLQVITLTQRSAKQQSYNLPPKSFFCWLFCLLCLAASQNIAHAGH